MTASRIERRPNPPRITTSISRVPSPLRSSHGFAYAKHIVTRSTLCNRYAESIVMRSPSLREAHRYAEHIVTRNTSCQRYAESIVTRSPSLCKAHRDIVQRSPSFLQRSPSFRKVHHPANHLVTRTTPSQRYPHSIDTPTTSFLGP